MGAIEVGATPTYGRRVGTKEVRQVFVGDELVWPPVQRAHFLGATSANAATVAFPAHQPGDLLVVVATSMTKDAPALPSGWIPAFKSSGTDALGVRIGYKFAPGVGTANPTWTGAGYITGMVFRGVDSDTPFGEIATSAVINAVEGVAPAITPKDKSGESAVVASFATSDAAVAAAPPVGWLQASRTGRIVNSLRTDSRIVEPCVEPGSAPGGWRASTFEVLPDDDDGVQFIGTNIGGSATVNLPSHQPGDLLILIAQTQSTASGGSPSKPAAGGTVPNWTIAYDSDTDPTGKSMPMKFGWAIATSSSHTSGTWLGTTWPFALVFRRTDQTNPIGAVAGQVEVAAGTSASTPALTLQTTDGSSMPVAYYCTSHTGTLDFASEDAAPGWVGRSLVSKSRIASRLDGTSCPPQEETHAAAGLTWRTLAFEIKGA